MKAPAGIDPNGGLGEDSFVISDDKQQQNDNKQTKNQGNLVVRDDFPSESQNGSDNEEDDEEATNPFVTNKEDKQAQVSAAKDGVIKPQDRHSKSQ